MARSELQVSSFEHEILKQSLIEFLQSTEEFGDFDYEGSAINTIVDLLTRDAHMLAYLANMLGAESFIASAQKRGNVVSHAQKLSYTPRSRTASRIYGNVTVTPADTTTADAQIVMNKGTQFLGTVDGSSYTFTTTDTYTSLLRNGKYNFTDVILKQGNLLTNKFVYSGEALTIPNQNVDSSTISVTDQSNGSVYTRANSIEELSSTSRVFFLSENQFGLYEVSFGRNVLGLEPDNNAVISIDYINTETKHANGLSNLIAATTISGFSNIQFVANDPSFGGYDREDIESIRWTAPKFYEAQDRGVTSSDYVPLLKKNYPFIKSAKTWGGEKNDPPKYGTIQISILADNDALITQSVKNEMIESVSGKNVGSVTPEIVDPYLIGLDLTVHFGFDYRQTNKTFNQLSEIVRQVCSEYNDFDLYDFDLYYNQSELESRILDIVGITTVSIEKKVYKDIDVLSISDPIYEISFNNEIEPGSVSMDSFIISADGTDHKLYDNEEGLVFISYNRQNSSNVEVQVGSVDYQTGLIEFTANFIQDAKKIKVYAQTIEDNFYVEQNNVVFIDNISTQLLNTKRR